MNEILAGNFTFLYTDIEGSTQLWEHHPEAMKLALARHDAIMRHAVETHNGQVFKMIGDAFCTVFSSAPDALSAALAAQHALHAESWGEAPIKVRMALHTGPAEIHDGDYVGPMLNRLARLLTAGHGGQTLVSAATYELVQAYLPPDAELCDMGERRLKDLIRPEHIYQLLAPDLPAQFPPLKTLDIFRTNLPAQLTSFIGREKEIAEVKQLIGANHLTTLTGPGGAGKTRLSLQVAAALLDHFLDGLWFVELAPLSDPALVVQTVTTTLGLRGEAGRPLLDILSDHLRAKTALLILDNCEHVVTASAQLAQALLQACPKLRILTSSRETLRIPGEKIYRVPSLSVPNVDSAHSVDALMQSEAARLFIDRAQIALNSFTLMDRHALTVAQICSRLDGIPLAIELAAARVNMLNVKQIAERLDDRFHLLTGGSRTALPRQQTLRALIDWSYDLLSEPERALLRRLSVFAGGWTLEAAETVCGEQLPVNSPSLQGGEQPLLDTDVLDLLTKLVNKSLVIVDAKDETKTRYGILETIRQYAREKLSDASESKEISDRHLEYFLGLAERTEQELTGRGQGVWLKRLEDELDNLRAALNWSLKQDVQVGLHLASDLMRYWPANNNVREGIDWLSQLLRQPAASTRNAARAKALTALGSLNNWQVEGSRAEPFARESLAIYQELGDQNGIALALHVLGGALCYQGNYDEGRPFMLQSLALYKTLGDTLGASDVLNWLGSFVDNQDDACARAYLEESLALCRTLDHSAGIASRLFHLGHLALQRGDYASASPQLMEALQIQRDLSMLWDMTRTIDQLGELAFLQNDYEQARVYFEETLSLENKMGDRVGNLWATAKLGYVILRRGNSLYARSLFEESLRGFKEVANLIGMVYALEGLASLAVLQERPEQAARLIARADMVRETHKHYARPPVEQADVDRELAAARAQLDESTFAAAQAAGRAMSMDEAIAYALDATL